MIWVRCAFGNVLYENPTWYVSLLCVLAPHILAFVPRPAIAFYNVSARPSLHYITPHFIAFHYVACFNFLDAISARAPLREAPL